MATEERVTYCRICELSRRIGATPASAWPLRALGKLGVRISPRV